MSCSLTTDAVCDRRKTVTRRLGWWFLKVGDRVQLCRKCMGRRAGEPLERLAVVEVVAVRGEPLDAIDQSDVIREGFADMTPAEFVTMFCQHMRCGRDERVNRIEWRYVE